MMTYKDKTWCTYDNCTKHFPSKCDKVLTDYDLKNIREGDFLLSVFGERPECFELDDTYES